MRVYLARHLRVAGQARLNGWDEYRIAAQSRPFTDADRPLGDEGRGWEFRETDIDEALWADLLAGKHAGDEQDRLHLAWWESAQ